MYAVEILIHSLRILSHQSTLQSIRSYIHLRFCAQATGRIRCEDYRLSAADSSEIAHENGTTAPHVAYAKLKSTFSPQSTFVCFVRLLQ